MKEWPESPEALLVSNLEIIPGKLKAVALPCLEKIGDSAHSQSRQGQGERACKWIITGIARCLLRNLVIRLPYAVAVQAIAAKANMQAGQIERACSLAYRRSTGPIIERIHHQSATLQ